MPVSCLRFWIGCAALALGLFAAGAAQQGGAPASLPVVPGSGPLKGERLYDNSHALLIGINRYPNLRPDDQLECAENDAVRLREVLIRSYGFSARNVRLLLGSQATKAAIQDALTDLADAERVTRGDRVLIYFSGHGKDVRINDDSRGGFLLPADAQVSLLKPNPATYLRTCLPMDDFQRLMRLSPAKHVLADLG